MCPFLYFTYFCMVLINVNFAWKMFFENLILSVFCPQSSPEELRSYVKS